MNCASITKRDAQQSLKTSRQGCRKPLSRLLFPPSSGHTLLVTHMHLQADGFEMFLVLQSFVELLLCSLEVFGHAFLLEFSLILGHAGLELQVVLLLHQRL